MTTEYIEGSKLVLVIAVSPNNQYLMISTGDEQILTSLDKQAVTDLILQLERLKQEMRYE